MVNAPDIANIGGNPDKLISLFNSISSFCGKNPMVILGIVVALFVFAWWINRRLKGKDKY